jgi:hypothetical protein
MKPRSRQSILHLQMGQEVIYLLLTVALVAALVLVARAGRRAAPLLPEPAAAPAAPPAPLPTDGSDLPPIIMLSEAQGYFFPLGSAEISLAFRQRLAREVVPRIRDLGRRHRVDVIEVLGHTDEIPLRLDRRTNLDLALLPYLNATAEMPPLQAADNVGLGMARAAAVARELLLDPRLHGYTVLPLSAGQAIAVDQSLATGERAADERMRRRIELRLRRR